jgi:hypothetical protein
MRFPPKRGLEPDVEIFHPIPRNTQRSFMGVMATPLQIEQE